MIGMLVWRKNMYGQIKGKNGVVKKDGCAVMGGGIALEAKERFPNLPKRLGELLS